MTYCEGIRMKQAWSNRDSMISRLWMGRIKTRKPQDDMYRNFQSHTTDSWRYANGDGPCKGNLKVGTHCNVAACRNALTLQVTDTIGSYQLNFHPVLHGVTVS